MKLALLIAAIAGIALLRRPRVCGDLHMFPYSHPDDFGYQDWACILPKGHDGEHVGRNPDIREWWFPAPRVDRDAWPEGVGW